MNILAEMPVMNSILVNEMGKKTKEDKWTIRPDEELNELMKNALEATGADRTELILQCIREELPDVVKKLIAERKRSEQAFWNSPALKKTKPDTGK